MGGIATSCASNPRVAYLLMVKNMAKSISDVINKGKLELDYSFSKLRPRIIRVGDHFGSRPDCLSFNNFYNAFNHQPSSWVLLHPDVEVNIPHFLSNRPLLNKLFDSRIIETGYFRARELSYLVDYVDYKFFRIIGEFRAASFLIVDPLRFFINHHVCYFGSFALRI